ncbi:MAG: hypothetical protein E6344_13375 [Clostridium sp.]|nr:hypothetical protein [Clostridium sp.]MDU7084686.1 hypothetical protein [Clostridium sp.]
MSRVRLLKVSASYSLSTARLPRKCQRKSSEGDCQKQDCLQFAENKIIFSLFTTILFAACTRQATNPLLQF